MTSILFALAVIALVVYGLERNHRRQLHLGASLAGSTDVEDRDVPREVTDLHASAVHSTPARTAPRRPVAPVRSMHPARSA